MRVFNGLMALLLLLFAVVQYNDPDFFIWMPIYLVPAIWAGIAAIRPASFRNAVATGGLHLCLLAAVAGTIYAWPTDEGWWQREVWWESELAREGMGLMIVTVSLLVVAVSSWWLRRQKPQTPA